MSKILVLDDIIPEYIQDRIYHDCLIDSNVPYFYNSKISNKENDTQYGFGLNLFMDRDLCHTKTDHFFKFMQVPYLVINHLGLILNRIYMSRVFLQPSIPNFIKTDGGIHVDLDFPHEVCLYYVNDTDGDTVFYDNDNNEIKRITPKKGRVAFFDGQIKHSATPPSKGVRIVINTCIQTFTSKLGEEKKN
tara:strand:+ start:560 stop:1129 length:570 start_codon:yes stop_codon:yes gene_type:complete